MINLAQRPGVISILIALMLQAMSCSRPGGGRELTHVRFNFQVPSSPPSSLMSWGGAVPTSAATIDCVGVFVSYPEDSAKGTCYSPSGTALLTLSAMVGTFSPANGGAGTFLSGDARTFYLIGFQSDDGTCSALSSLNEDNFSYPYLLGYTNANLNAPTSTVSLQGSFSSAQEFNDCSGGPFDINVEGYYGNGQLGDETYDSTDGSAGTIYLDTISAGSRFAQILEIDTSVGNVVTVSSSDVANFSVGDMVMWYVSSFGSSATDCGASTTRSLGAYDFTTVESISGNNITLTDDIEGPGDSTINDATTGTLRSTSSSNGSNWCKIQLIKVPQFRNLTLQSGSTLTINQSHNSSTGKGGILAIAVSGTLTLAGGDIQVNGKGFVGSTTSNYSGYGRMGNSNSGSVAGGGGAGVAGSSGGGGGGSRGANGGRGGYYSSANSNGGLSYGTCSSSHCLILGGGGGIGELAGGDGGGGIVIRAYNIAVTGASSLKADATNGTGDTSAYDGGGGGAGGNIIVETNEISGSDLVYSVIGGNGGNGSLSEAGGGGGGGYIEVRSCSSYSFPGSGVSYSGGSAGNTGTYAGVAGDTPSTGTTALTGSDYCH